MNETVNFERQYFQQQYEDDAVETFEAGDLVFVKSTVQPDMERGSGLTEAAQNGVICDVIGRGYHGALEINVPGFAADEFFIVEDNEIELADIDALTIAENSDIPEAVELVGDLLIQKSNMDVWTTRTCLRLGIPPNAVDPLYEISQAINEIATERDGYLATVKSCQPVFEAYGAACREAVKMFGHMPIDFNEWLSDYVRQHEAMKTEIESLHQPGILAQRVRVLEAKLTPFAKAALIERASGTPDSSALVGTWTEKDIHISDTEHLCVRHLNEALDALPELKAGSAANARGESA